MILDVDASGYIQVHDFISCLRSLGMRFEDKAAEESFRIIDRDGDGHITMSEFVSWFSLSFDAQQPRHDVRTRFARFMSRAKRRLRRRAMDQARARTSITCRTRIFEALRETELYRITSFFSCMTHNDVEDIKWRQGRSDLFVWARRSSELLRHAYRVQHSNVMRDRLRFEILKIKENGFQDEDAMFVEYDEDARDSLSAKSFERVMVDLRLPYDLLKIREIFEKLRDPRTNRVMRDQFVKWLSDSLARVQECKSTLSRLHMRYKNTKLGMQMLRRRWSNQASRSLAAHELLKQDANRAVRVALETYGSLTMTEKEMSSRASDVFAMLTREYLESLHHDESSTVKIEMTDLEQVADSEFMKVDTNARGYVNSETCANLLQKIASARFGLSLERPETLFKDLVTRKKFISIFSSEQNTKRMFLERCAGKETKSRVKLMRWCSYVDDLSLSLSLSVCVCVSYYTSKTPNSLHLINTDTRYREEDTKHYKRLERKVVILQTES